jgi:hypothetical protein
MATTTCQGGLCEYSDAHWGVEPLVEVMSEADVWAVRCRQTLKDVDDRRGGHSADWCKRAADNCARLNPCVNDAKRWRVAAVARLEAEGDGGFCNLRLSVMESAQLLGNRTFDETGAKVRLPTAARYASATSAYAASPLRRTSFACIHERRVVDAGRIELPTSALRTQRSPS